MRGTATGLAAIALLSVAAGPTEAQATIIPQRGMYGVKIGDTVREVRARLGKPDLDGKWRPPIDRILSYPRRKLYVGFKGKGRKGRVVWMSLRSRRERLANGVGIGTTKDEAIRKFPHLTCPVEEPFHCYLGRFEFGRVVTDFRWGNDSRIAVIDLARVSSAQAQPSRPG